MTEETENASVQVLRTSRNKGSYGQIERRKEKEDGRFGRE